MYTPAANTYLTHGAITIAIDMVEHDTVFYRRWVGDIFNGFYRLPVSEFCAQVAKSQPIVS